MRLHLLVPTGLVLCALLHTGETNTPLFGAYASPDVEHHFEALPVPDHAFPEHKSQEHVPVVYGPQGDSALKCEPKVSTSGKADVDSGFLVPPSPIALRDGHSTLDIPTLDTTGRIRANVWPREGVPKGSVSFKLPLPTSSGPKDVLNDGPSHTNNPSSDGRALLGVSKHSPPGGDLPKQVPQDDDIFSYHALLDTASSTTVALDTPTTGNQPPTNGVPPSGAARLPPPLNSPLQSVPQHAGTVSNHGHFSSLSTAGHPPGGVPPRPALGTLPLTLPSHSTPPSGDPFSSDDKPLDPSPVQTASASNQWPTESALRCVGADMVDRSCHFRNLVYDKHLGLFKFHAPMATLEQMPEISNLTKQEWLGTKRFLILGALRFKDVPDFRIAFLDEPFPPKADTCEEAEPSYLHTVYNGASYGHLLRDNFNIIAGNLLRLGLAHKNHKLLVMNRDVSDVVRKYGSYIAPTVRLFDEAVARCDRRFVLFRDLVGGHGYRTLLHVRENHERGGSCSPPPFLAQREIALRLAGLPVVAVSDIPVIRVLILDRDPEDKRRINNIPDILAPLRQRFPDAQIVSHTLLHLSPRDQLRYLSQTSILVTTIGSASFRLLYLPTDAHVILIGSPENVNPKWASAAVHEAEECWNLIQYVTIDVYHVTEAHESVQRFVKKKYAGSPPNPRALVRDSDIHVNVTKLGDLLEAAIADVRFHRLSHGRA